MFAISTRQSMRPIVFDAFELFPFVLAEAFVAQINRAEPEAADDEYCQKRDDRKPSHEDAAFSEISGWIDIGC